MVSQSTWNLLFGWLTGRQCFLPEGCSVPLEGVVFYLGVAVLLIAAVKFSAFSKLRERWSQPNE